MSLTAEQLERFDRDGYISIPHRLIEPDHLERLRGRYDAQFAERRGTVGQGMRNLAVVGESESDPDADRSEEMLQIMEMWKLDDEYRQLLYHPPLLDVAECLVGPDIQVFHDQALYKPAQHGGAVHWHQDNGYWRCDPPNLVSIWMPWDDADEDNGCMTMIPGSHREGAASRERAATEKGENPSLLMADVDESKAVRVPIKAGYGLLHHCRTLHSTAPNRSERDRRAMVVHYMSSGTRNAQGAVMTDNLVLRGSGPDATA